MTSLMNDESNLENDLLILIVVGMPASGKSEVLKKIVSDYHFFHIYFGSVTFLELEKRGLPINEKNERLVREELRQSGDLGVYAKLMLPKIDEAIKNGEKKIILESVYNVQEYEVLNEKYGKALKVLAIHSDKDIRIKRLNERKERPLTEEELKSRELSEAKNLFKGTLIAMADYHFLNNGSDMQVFENDLKELLKNKLNL